MSTPVIQTVTPQQVASLGILKNKQLHIVEDYHEGILISQVLQEYEELIRKFLRDNKLSCYTITTTIYETGNKYNKVPNKKPNKILILIK